MGSKPRHTTNSNDGMDIAIGDTAAIIGCKVGSLSPSLASRLKTRLAEREKAAHAQA